MNKAAETPAYEPSKYLQMKEVTKLLGLTRRQLLLRCARGEIPYVRRAGVRVFPRAQILSRFAKQSGDEGKRQALAFELIAEGKSNDVIVRELEMPIELVKELRAERGSHEARSREEDDDGQDEEDERAIETESSVMRTYEGRLAALRARRAERRAQRALGRSSPD